MLKVVNIFLMSRACSYWKLLQWNTSGRFIITRKFQFLGCLHETLSDKTNRFQPVAARTSIRQYYAGVCSLLTAVRCCPPGCCVQVYRYNVNLLKRTDVVIYVRNYWAQFSRYCDTLFWKRHHSASHKFVAARNKTAPLTQRRHELMIKWWW